MVVVVMRLMSSALLVIGIELWRQETSSLSSLSEPLTNRHSVAASMNSFSLADKIGIRVVEIDRMQSHRRQVSMAHYRLSDMIDAMVDVHAHVHSVVMLHRIGRIFVVVITILRLPYCVQAMKTVDHIDTGVDPFVSNHTSSLLHFGQVPHGLVLVEHCDFFGLEPNIAS
jgi:hypothetical protein